MLSATKLQELAIGAAEAAEELVEQDELAMSQQSLLICAIYTVGAELIGRLDNLHFEGNLENYQTESTSYFNGWFYSRKDAKNDNSSKSKDRSASQEGAPTPGSPEGQRREGAEGS